MNATDSPINWLEDLASTDDWGADLSQPYDDAPAFEQADTEVDTALRLKDDRRMVRAPTRRLFQDYRANPDAYRHISPLPLPGESIHGIISGKYALWELVPAVLEATGDVIDELIISTLSFNKQNASDLLGLLDTGHVRNVALLISYFFKAQNRPLYDLLVPQLIERGHGVRAIRTHAKLLLMKMRSGTKYVVESSANLRSSQNIEAFVFTTDNELYEFHRRWIQDEILTGKELG